MSNDNETVRVKFEQLFESAHQALKAQRYSWSAVAIVAGLFLALAVFLVLFFGALALCALFIAWCAVTLLQRGEWFAGTLMAAVLLGWCWHFAGWVRRELAP